MGSGWQNREDSSSAGAACHRDPEGRRPGLCVPWLSSAGDVPRPGCRIPEAPGFEARSPREGPVPGYSMCPTC